MMYDIKLVDTEGTHKFYPTDRINELHTTREQESLKLTWKHK